MARPNKIEQHQLHKVVTKGAADGWSTRQIAAECSRVAKEPISHVAVARYLETLNQKKEAVVSVPGRVEKIVNYDLDIIDLQYQTTRALYDRFQFINGLPEMFAQRMASLIETVLERDGDDPEYLGIWKTNFVDELRKNITNISLLNRELRQNAQFMTQLREKAFEFNLITEYLEGFLEEFRKVNQEAFEIASERMSLNPRLQRIIDQIKQMGGGEHD